VLADEVSNKIHFREIFRRALQRLRLRCRDEKHRTDEPDEDVMYLDRAERTNVFKELDEPV